MEQDKIHINNEESQNQQSSTNEHRDKQSQIPIGPPERYLPEWEIFPKRKIQFEYEGRKWEVRLSRGGPIGIGAGSPLGPLPKANLDIIVFTCLEEDRSGKEEKQWWNQILHGTFNDQTPYKFGQLLKGAWIQNLLR